VVLGVDNVAIWHGWNKRGLPNEISGSIFIRALYLISYYLGCTVYVTHVPRMSSIHSCLADSLSRVSSTKDRDLAMLEHAQQPDPPTVLLDWLSNPEEDWDFVFKLLDYVRNKFTVH